MIITRRESAGDRIRLTAIRSKTGRSGETRGAPNAERGTRNAEKTIALAERFRAHASNSEL